MVSNPMQKKARNSFLLGVVITLVICLIIGAIVYMLVIAPNNKEKDKERGKEVIAYVLKKDVKSGEVITSGMLEQITVYENMVPKNYIDSAKLNELISQEVNGNEDVPAIAKIDLYAKSIVTSDSIAKSDQVVTSDVRYVEYNMLTLPTNLTEGEYIDIRLTLPNGQDLVVLSKKEVKSILGDTIGLELTENEIVTMESAIVEAYIMTASKFYVAQYVEPGRQQASIATYYPTAEVVNLINKNPNIVEHAKNAYEQTIREAINKERANYQGSQTENLETGIQKEIQNAKAAREAYLEGLDTY